MKPALKPGKSYAYQVRGTHRLFARLLEKHIANRDIKAADWYLLRVLWEKDGISQKELSRCSFLTESSVVSMLHSMTEAGLVVRERDQADKRCMKIKLTAKGRALEEEMLPLVREINLNAARGIDLQDLKTFMRVLSQMKDNLEEQLSPGSGGNG